VSIIEPSDVLLCGMLGEYLRLKVAFPNNLVLTGTAKNNLSTLVPSFCRRIISMGLAGGLCSPIKIADVVLASSVTDDDGNIWFCDPKFNGQVIRLAQNALPESPGPQDPMPTMWNAGLRIVPWYSSGVGEADTAAQRSTLYTATHAWMIDDETYFAAQFAKANDIAFNVMRSCSDDASETLPLAARGAVMNAGGSINAAALIQELETEPLLQTLELPAIAADYFLSLDTLQAAAQAVGS
jgi:hypothetical protein